jgi:hypothetical protein
VSKVHIDDVVNSISDMVQMPYIKTTNESQKIMNDALLAAKCKAEIVTQFPYSNITADNGHVFVTLQASLAQEDTIMNTIHKKLKNIAQIKNIKVSIVPRYEA